MRPVQFLLTMFAILARLIGGTSMIATAAKWFIPLCFIAAAYNMSIGVRQEGYGVVEELPFLLLNFGLPSLVAFGLLQKVL